MSGNLEQFHDIFFEEADELIESMESELLEMVFDPENPERINTVFRAAHSIKGGAATFGFSTIAETTHVMETLMEGVRGGTTRITRDLVDTFLTGVDCVRELLAAAKSGGEVDEKKVRDIQDALQSCYQASGEPSAPLVEPVPAEPVPAEPVAVERDAARGELLESGELASSAVESAPERSGTPQAGSASVAADPAETVLAVGDNQALWRYSIRFKPSLELFRTGNDPLHVLRALRDLGHLEVELDQAELPALEDLDPEKLYLAWTLTLESRADEALVREVFAWVEDACELVIGREVLLDGADATADSRDPIPAGEGDSRRPQKRAPVESSSIRVGIDKIDTLINLVGELVITQSMLSQMGKNIDTCDLVKLREGFAQLERHTRALQENVMQIRMVPVSSVFNRLPRMIHDLSTSLGKKVDLIVQGENTEVDKTVIEKIGDPLLHLVRNAVDHGIESAQERVASGKPAHATLTLNAFHASGNVMIEISDDGAGLNLEKILAKARANGLVSEQQTLSEQEIQELIFKPGFSTADTVSEISGRGVGMDVVRRNILDLGGAVEVISKEGVGSRFTIRLPLTLAIVDGQLIEVGGHVYVIPLVSIVESVQLQNVHLSTIAEQGQIYRVRDEYIPVVCLAELFNIPALSDRPAESLLVVVESGHGKVGLLVNDLLAQQQVVIKSLESNFRKVDAIAGATILGDGTVALILDIPGLVEFSRRNPAQPNMTAGSLRGPRAA